MTAEVAVMNKAAVALAADSAVTSGGGIYNTANKLFTLSKYHPVGIMIYGSADLMGVPWSTLIKMYREHLGDNGFDTTEDYAKDFCRYIRQALTAGLVPSDHLDGFTQNHFKRTAHLALTEVANQTIWSFFESANEPGAADDIQVHEVFNHVLEKERERFERRERVSIVSEEDVTSSVEGWRELVHQVLTYVLKNLPLLAFTDTEKIDRSVAEQLVLLTATRKWVASTGIVIAGFGTREIFPSFVNLDIETVYNGQLKHSKELHLQTESNVYPFAHSDVINALVKGMRPELREVLNSYLWATATTFSAQIAEFLPRVLDLSGEQSTQLTAVLRNLSANQIKESRSLLDQWEVDNEAKIKNNLNNLPKDELAATAKTFVNVTAFMKRVQMDEDETVGGPIDVALISKGDGFIWIERKHYFHRDLNHHFFDNYYLNSPISLTHPQGDDA